MELKHKMYRKYIKRILDLLIAGGAFVIFLPVFVVVAMFVRVRLGSPVIYRQQRLGRRNKEFCLYKFRTMTNATNEQGDLLSDRERLTGFGEWLRRTSLDEMPQLFNIIKGDMSIIGPRPLVVKYLPYYTDAEIRRHEVRPGLTGLAQVSGRNAIEWETRFRLDVKYVDDLSACLDLHIFFATIKTILHPNDVILGGEGEIDFDEVRKEQWEKMQETKGNDNV